MKALSNHVIRDHVLIGGIAALALSPVLGAAESLFFWLATIFVDIDHYFEFLWFTRFKHLGPKSMFRFFEELFQLRNREGFLALEIFHTVEFLICFGLFALWQGGALLAIFWGVLFHMVVDFFHLLRYRSLGKRSPSFLEYAWRKKRYLSEGKNPELVFEEALRASRQI